MDRQMESTLERKIAAEQEREPTVSNSPLYLDGQWLTKMWMVSAIGVGPSTGSGALDPTIVGPSTGSGALDPTAVVVPAVVEPV